MRKIYGFKIGKHLIDIEAHSEQEAFRLLGENFWHLISNYEKVELLGELKKNEVLKDEQYREKN